MNVLMISPGYPAEMPRFTRALARAGARVFGVGDQPQDALPASLAQSLAAYFQAPDLWNEGAIVDLARRIHDREPIHRVECLWEAGMLLAAVVREALRLPGLSREQAVAFRDKEVMKQVLDRAGIRTPRHSRVRTREEARHFARAIGYPVILKPISGAGATDTYPVGDDGELEGALARLGHVDEVSLEEFVEGDEFTFDTISIGGRIAFHNVAWYRPRPLDAKQHEWISPQAICLRRPEAPELSDGVRMGLAVLEAMRFSTGFTHMEWYRKADGEVVFGEIGARPPGARLVDVMNFASDLDLYLGWAEAVVHGRFSQRVERKYNAAVIFKRARGEGRIQRIEGLERLQRHFGPAIAAVELLPIGHPRRDWRHMQISDGYLIVRHPELQATLEIADRVGSELTLHAG
ncbi:MAG: hypothetical protein R2991_08325 [Thermoanaerobaculia bacterium]